jgi:Asp-tRNA(Asn)/Glu-tRNA(Gln) amidotransferase C subunit
MKIDDQMIDRISRLACIEFEEEEKEKIRQDIMAPSISTEEALMNAPQVSGRFFRVPKTFRKS